MVSPFTVYVDLRCLQDPAYAERGVGFHAAGLLRHARRWLDLPVRLRGLTDPHLPELSRAYRALVDECLPCLKPPAGRESALFVELSPATHPQASVASLIGQEHIFSCAVVYDFIPLKHKSYTPTPSARLAYLHHLLWLRQYDLFCPISESTAQQLQQVVDPPADAVAVTGACLREVFQKAMHWRASRRPYAELKFHPQGYLVTVGGMDERKNTRLVLKAHADLTRHQPDLGLVVVGHLTDPYRAELKAFYQAQGGMPAKVQFLADLRDEELAAVYHHALAVVVASRFEGFSLPVVEAAACGSPVLASRIEAHEELIAREEAFFDPQRPDELVRRTLALINDHDLREELLAQQQTRAADFAEGVVAERFWRHVGRHLKAWQKTATPRLIASRPRLAFVTPFPPDRSGVADYTAQSLAELGKLADVDVFTDARPTRDFAGVRRLLPLCELPYVNGRYDRVVSVIGNSHFHETILKYHQRHGGACLAHDPHLADYYYWTYSPGELVRRAALSLGRTVTLEEATGWLAQPLTLPTIFYDDLLPQADPLLVHSPTLRDRIKLLYNHDARALPFCCYRTFTDADLREDSRREARQRLGLPPDQVVLVTLGFQGPAKYPTDAVWTLETLRAWGLPAHLYFVGDVQGSRPALQELAQRLKLTDSVHLADRWLDEEDFRDFLLAADFGIQLRCFGQGALSGALCDCASAGLPTVATYSLAESMEMPDYVLRIPDRCTPLLTAEKLLLAHQEGRHLQRISGDRDQYVATHNFAEYARRMLAALQLAA